MSVLVKLKLKEVVYDIKINMKKYEEMEKLAKELGMLGIMDYIIYCMNVVLESHNPPTLLA